MLTKLSQEHKITVSCMCSDHPKFTAGGSVSNHYLRPRRGHRRDRRRDRRPRQPARARGGVRAARARPATYRPDEIGSPFAITGPGYFTDAAHQNHIHIGFKTEIDPDWKPPADVARPAAPPRPPPHPRAPAAATPGAPVASAAAAPGQPAAAVAAAAEPKAKAGDSLSFKAVTAEDAARAAKGGDELSFMQPPAGPPSAVAAGAVPPVVADAATATAGGSSSLGASALEVAKGELAKGVHEEGVNTGAEVDQYLEGGRGRARATRGARAFVTWSLEQAGHKMPGSGWAAVQTWVRNAEAGQQRPRGRQRRGRAPGRHRRLRLGRPGATSAPTATSGSSTATSRTASSPRWRATTTTRS